MTLPTRPEHPPRTPLREVVDWLRDQSGADAQVSEGEQSGTITGTITGVTLSSRSVVPGDLYVAPQGASAHGAQYAAQAELYGAEGFDAAFDASEIVIGRWRVLNEGNGILQGASAGAYTRDGGAREASRVGIDGDHLRRATHLGAALGERSHRTAAEDDDAIAG